MFWSRFQASIKTATGRIRYRSSGRSSFLPSKDEAPTHGPWRQTCQRGRRCAGAGDAALLSARISSPITSQFSPAMPPRCAGSTKNMPGRNGLSPCRRRSVHHANNVNLPLHIPEPLSMTRAAISSSSAMVAVGSFVGQVLLSLWAAGSRSLLFRIRSG